MYPRKNKEEKTSRKTKVKKLLFILIVLVVIVGCDHPESNCNCGTAIYKNNTRVESWYYNGGHTARRCNVRDTLTYHKDDHDLSNGYEVNYCEEKSPK